MYKVLIADDENIVRVALRNMVDYEALGFTVCATAEDGAAALALCGEHRPALVITDLKMPGMDGLELIRRLKSAGFEGKILIISNYDDFDMVREGMVLGASDYLLKLTVTTEEYADALRRMKRELDEQRQRQLADCGMRADLQRLRREQEARRWGLLLSAGPPEDGSCDALLEGGYSDLFFIQIHDYPRAVADSGIHDRKMLYYAIENIALETLSQRGEVLLGALSEGTLFAVKRKADGGEVASRYAGRKLCEVLTRYLNIAVTVSCAANLCTLEGALAARAAFAGQRARLFYQEAGAPSAFVELERAGAACGRWEAAPGWQKLLQEAVGLRGREQIRALLGEIFDSCAARLVPRQELARGLEGLLAAVGKGLGLAKEAAPPSLGGANSAGEARKMAEEALWGMAKICGGGARPREVEAILQYISGHISQKITLAQLAKLVSLNESYMCTLFRAHMGTSIVDYINQKKIEKARRRMEEEGVLIKNIALELGFADQFYFNRLFKKYCGISPSQYRRQHKNTPST